MLNGVELRDPTSRDVWMDFYTQNMWWNGKPLFTCVLAFDKHNVIDQMNEEETARFIGLRNQVNFNNNLGGALAMISRGTK